MVGGDGDPTKRGVVSTASYEAREHGVHSGLPLRTAARRLPDAVFLPVDRPAYEEVSETVMTVLRSTGAVVEVLGWDEAFLGVETSDPEGFARSLAARVRSATELDCTVGIGENKLQAKIATGFGKPAGVFRLTFANWFEVLGGRPTDALWGIGAKTAKKLTDLGITVVAAAGNFGSNALGKLQYGAITAPGNAPWVLTVGASSTMGTLTRNDDTMASFSSSGKLNLAGSNPAALLVMSGGISEGYPASSGSSCSQI